MKGLIGRALSVKSPKTNCLYRKRPSTGGARPDPLTGRPLPWEDGLALAEPGEEDRLDRLRLTTLTGRPCGDDQFTAELEQQLGQSLFKQPPDRKPRGAGDDENQLELPTSE